MTVDASGNVVGYDDYYPYGMIMTGRSLTPSGEDSRYKFVSNERDASTGLDHLGDRNYDSWLGRLLSVDPFGDKYPFLSPYNYGADNPISVIDYNGDSLWINDNGNNILYSTGMRYKGNNKIVGSVISNLNLLGKNHAGLDVINSLIVSKGNYNTVFDNNLGTPGQFVGNGTQAGGTITLNPNSISFETLAHEIFHGYQQENGTVGASRMSEAEAYLFSGAMTLSLTGKNPFIGTEWNSGANYLNDVSNLLNSYNDITFWNMVQDFPSGSMHNIDNGYSKLPYYMQNQKVIIHNIYPLLKRR